MTCFFDFWKNIDYMAELLLVCILFMLPAKKRNLYRYRVVATAFCLLLASWLFNSRISISSRGILYFLYWAAYLCAALLFVWINLDCPLSSAVFCTFFACAVQHIAHDFYMIAEVITGSGEFFALPVYIAVYAAAYFIIVRRLPRGNCYAIGKSTLIPIDTILLIMWILSVLESSGLNEFEARTGARVIYRILDALCCIYIIWAQIEQAERMALQRELDGIDFAWKHQKSQYEMTKEAIENINRKCHDLKHQISALRKMDNSPEKAEYLKEIEEDIMVYDNALSTGNKGLDVVLMDKGLYCKTHDIQLSYMIDGAQLDFMKLADIYAVFGNALDNAVYSVQKIKEPDKRVISMKMITQNGLLMIQIQNYFTGVIHFEDGLPVTTQKDSNHGYGMKSIRHTVEEYNGTITVNTKDDIFTLQILIPVPTT